MQPQSRRRDLRWSDAMPGRFFDIQVKPSNVTVAPGKTQQITYEVTNQIGRPVMASFVIVPPEPGKAAWVTVTNSNTRQLAPAVKQDFTVSVTPPADAPQGDAQFGVFVKDQGDPERVFDPGPPFTVKVQGEAAPGPKPLPPQKWIIPVAIAAGLVVVAGVLWFALPRKHTLPNVIGLSQTVAAETLKAHGLTDSIAGTQNSPEKADGTVLRQEPADTGAARTDSLYKDKKLVRLTIAAPSVLLPDLRNLPLLAALDTSQKLTLLIGNLSPRVTSNPADTQKVLEQQPQPGRVPKGEKVTLTVGVLQPPADPGCKGIRCFLHGEVLKTITTVNTRGQNELSRIRPVLPTTP
jgi:hypothetical protein